MPNELQDVTVEKLGLVERGANQEEFFLLKADAGNVETRITETVWQRLIGLFKKSAEIESVECEDVTIAKVSIEDGDNMTEAEAMMAKAEKMMADARAMLAEAKAMQKQPMQKEEPIMSDMIAKSDYDVLVKSVGELQERLAKAELIATAARDNEARTSEIVKAGEISALPINPVEYGDNLYKLGKFDPALKTYFANLVKTADGMLCELGIFGEQGTAQSAIDTTPVMKAANSANPREALLSLSPKDAALYVASRQAATK